ncbi:uracil-5-carboxylate decarboxylase [Eremomyces bilateralis CBS 781.70]|uniref:Uracil-5-carboxylate decarboxylase n=1 Tax=Eremomyces bilateralis CBS 781.70 TaxID=1392243 RepID=A0A6G1GAA9_9PEZI|nr:uracil-5-carboxylate decarboxylase [Eremomyces bilateralis CBS 781.70]KAF1814942.1 uracil-5-carboxylate decarboxylase [Eremomyces bilateralis CBS 781.70]
MSVVDIHTHMYPPSYISLLQSRYDGAGSAVPYIRTFEDAPDDPRLIILPDEDAKGGRGRPVGPEYWSVEQKIAFMDTHNIETSVVSLANPWLDFLSGFESPTWAAKINDDFEAICASHSPRLFFFGVLPLSGPPLTIIAEIKRLQTLKYARGVVIGTTGLGRGLDDPEMGKIWEALEETNTFVFLHPHYGLPSSVYGSRASEYGHVLPLALGFPMETTIAVARMWISCVWDRYPGLQILLAHAGGAIPSLAGRLQSCLEHDGHLRGNGKEEGPKRTIQEVLKQNIYLDAVVYGEVGISAAVGLVGKDRVMFGTDHPFFPPLGADEKEWLSVRTNYDAIQEAFTDEQDQDAKGVLGGNAIKVLRLQVD